MLEIGMITQLGFLLIIIGFACLSKPYEYAKDQANDERLEKKAFKRQQRRKKKSERKEYKPNVNREVKEPGALAVNVMKVLGMIALAAGIILFVWSLF